MHWIFVRPQSTETSYRMLIPTNAQLMSRRHMIGLALGTTSFADLLMPRLEAQSNQRDADGFLLPAKGFVPRLPLDHGAHPGFKLEWWYVTGHLTDETGGFHGFQITFFRRASRIARSTQEPVLADDSELHLAHTALLDAKDRSFHHDERINRRGWDADAATDKLDVRNGNWSLRAIEPDVPDSPIALDGRIRGTHHLQLTLTPSKRLVVFGEEGVSKKGSSDSASSHYLTYPRLKAEGHLVRTNRPPLKLHGAAWMDHEISSSQLDPGQVGWDWLGIQLDDGREIMVYVLRRTDGSPDPASKITWIDRDGNTSSSDTSKFQLLPKGEWKSRATGTTYPASMLLVCRDPASERPLSLEITPRFDAQEMTSRLGKSLSYWEGACEVREGRNKIGNAYMELTGYGKAMTDVLR